MKDIRIKDFQDETFQISPLRRPRRLITLKEVRTHPERVATRVRRGEVLIVLKRSQPLFRLIKAYEDESRVSDRN